MAMKGTARKRWSEEEKEAGIGSTPIAMAIRSIRQLAGTAPARALERMPRDFKYEIHESIERAIRSRLNLLEAGLREL
jgi:hypothetical protein